MAKIFNGFESGKIYEDLYPQGGTQQIVVEDDFITITIHFPELRQDGSWRSEWCTKTIIKGSFIFKGNTFSTSLTSISSTDTSGVSLSNLSPLIEHETDDESVVARSEGGEDDEMRYSSINKSRLESKLSSTIALIPSI